MDIPRRQEPKRGTFELMPGAWANELLRPHSGSVHKLWHTLFCHKTDHDRRTLTASMRALAPVAGMSRATLEAAQRVLVDEGLLVIRQDPNLLVRGANQYQLIVLEDLAAALREERRG